MGFFVSGTWILNSSCYSDSGYALSGIPDFKVHSDQFHIGKNFPDSRLHVKLNQFPDSGIWIPLHLATEQ